MELSYIENTTFCIKNVVSQERWSSNRGVFKKGTTVVQMGGGGGGELVQKRKKLGVEWWRREEKG